MLHIDDGEQENLMVWFKIQNEREVVTKNGESKSLILESRDGDIVGVWSWIDLLNEELPLEGAYLCIYRLKEGKSGRMYFSYRLVRM